MSISHIRKYRQHVMVSILSRSWSAHGSESGSVASLTPLLYMTAVHFMYSSKTKVFPNLTSTPAESHHLPADVRLCPSALVLNISMYVSNSSPCTPASCSLDVSDSLVVLHQYLQQFVSPVNLVPDLAQGMCAEINSGGEI